MKLSFLGSILCCFLHQIPDGVTGDSVRERAKTFTYDFSYDSSDCKNASFVSQEKVSGNMNRLSAEDGIIV